MMGEGRHLVREDDVIEEDGSPVELTFTRDPGSLKVTFAQHARKALILSSFRWKARFLVH